MKNTDYTNHIEHYKTDAEFYDYFNFNKFMVEEIKRRYQEILHLGKPSPAKPILDIGSGRGGLILSGYPFSHYCPLDISRKNLTGIRNSTPRRVMPVSGDVFQLPFQTESFSFIILSEVLEHLSAPVQALKEIRRVLKPNGHLMVTVPFQEE
ncbi:MAG: class I SAM-dependent methyltransferase, partial [Calditrichia bacterium]